MTATHSINVAQGHSLLPSYKQSFGKVLAIFETRRNQIWSRQRFFTEVCWLPWHWILSNRLDSRSLHITYLSVYNQAWAKKRENSPSMDLKVFCYDTMVFHGCLLWPWPINAKTLYSCSESQIKQKREDNIGLRKGFKCRSALTYKLFKIQNSTLDCLHLIQIGNVSILNDCTIWGSLRIQSLPRVCNKCLD